MLSLKSVSNAVSPSKKKSRGAAEVKSNSPTHVTDFDDVQTSDENFLESSPHSTSDQTSQVFSSGASDSRRRPRQALHVLPTLDETSSGSSDSGGEKEVNTKDLCSPTALFPPGSEESFARKKKSERRAAGGQRKSVFDKLEEMKEKATTLAGTGFDDKAIDYYHKSLKVAIPHIDKIKTQMKNIEGKHPSTVDSIYSRLLEDLTTASFFAGDVRIALAVVSERTGNYKKALIECREAIDTFERHANLSDVKVDGASLKDRVVAAKALLKRHKDAQDSFEDRKKRHSRIVAFRRDMRLKGNTGALVEALKEAEQCRDIEIASLGADHPQVANTLSIMSDILLDKGEPEAALKLALEALSVSELSLGEHHPQTGRCLLSAARMPTVRDEEALNYYTRALEVFRRTDVPPDVIAVVLNEKAIIHIRRREYGAGIEELHYALDIQKHDKAVQTGGLLDYSKGGEVVQVLRNLGECHFQSRDFKQASRRLHEALNIQRNTKDVFEAVNQSQLGKVAEDKPVPPFASEAQIAETLKRLGKAYRSMGSLAKAQSSFKEAIQIHRIAVARLTNSVVSSNVPQALSRKQDELASVLYCLAEVCVDQNDLGRADRLFQDSLQLRMFSDANRPGNRINMIHCAMCLVGIGNVHMQRCEFDDAVRVFGEAMTYCEAHGVKDDSVFVRMIRDKEAEANSKRKSGGGISELKGLEEEAEVCMARGDLDAAVVALSRAMAIRRALLKLLKSSGQDPCVAIQETASTLDKFGDLLMRKGDNLHAKRAYEDSLKLYRKNGDEDHCEIVKSKLACIMLML